jgi:hypothetical protein
MLFCLALINELTAKLTSLMVNIAGAIIPLADRVKILGVTLDS